MSRKFSRLLPGLFLATIVALLVPNLVTAAELGKRAPDFTLKSLGGKNLKLSEMAGKVVLINFWASWCGPCREEMPLLNALHNKYEPLGFTVLGVNVEEDTNAAKGFLKNFPADFPVLLDNTNQVSRQYKVIAMPTTVVVDRDGNVRFLHQGYKPGDEAKYRQTIKKLVRE
ncbi:MAG TPA: TlpA disulfide reductase family protein [Gammaproteobacteria bacterium]|nr:TlpA disulfide reductase family protein [Gammaproteobacteria bacterium]